MTMNRTAWIVAGSLAALLIIVAVLLVVLIAQGNAAAADLEHQRIVEICRATTPDAYGAGLDSMIDCMERLKS